MISALLLSLALTAQSQPADTLVEMRRGDRLEISNLSGDVAIVGWDRDELEIRGEDARALTPDRTGSVVRLRAARPRRGRSSVDATIRVPAWVDVEVSGRALDLSVRGVEGEVRVGNVSGDLHLVDIGGPVDVRSIEGEIVVEGVRRGVRATSQSDDVALSRVNGAIDVHSGSGDIVLDEIESESVRAETQDGDIVFSGSIANGGDYGFFTHDGDAVVAIPRDADASVQVSTFDGDFESEFPVRVQRFTSGREFEFVLGDGSARVEIEVFDGEIRLLQRR